MNGRMNCRVTMALVGAACVAVVVAGTPAATQALPARARHVADSVSTGSVVVQDITIRVRHQQPVSAYLVRPSGDVRASSEAGVLWLHWLGQIHSDRSEFLPEAVSLAGRGVVSVLPQGEFPWAVAPSGNRTDIGKINRQVHAFHAALRRLEAVHGVDRSRLAIVGHDYGAMFGALLADRSPEVSTLVLDAPDATWGDWFSTYWLGYTGAQRRHYAQLFSRLDPVHHAARLGSHVLFQWAGQDVYVTKQVREAYAAQHPKAHAILYADADHQLTDAAAADRDTFLAEQLNLPAAASAR
jgi:pimeloyl-ACP methyl ester carboxylesterase